MCDNCLKEIGVEKPAFLPGKIGMSERVRDAVHERPALWPEIVALLKRHLTGDYGKVDREDQISNEAATFNGGRVLSAYPTASRTIWVITEGVGSKEPQTDIMYPEEY